VKSVEVYKTGERKHKAWSLQNDGKVLRGIKGR